MDRRATKSHGEREDEEVERLVRPSPKVKPPRHDLRRETVEVDVDPDKKPDKDLSKNYKDIGGSCSRERALVRWVLAKNNAMENALRDRVKAKNSRVKVRAKDTGWVGWISEEKLKSDPARYELTTEKTTPPPKPKSSAPPKAKSSAPPKSKSSPPKPATPAREPAQQSQVPEAPPPPSPPEVQAEPKQPPLEQAPPEPEPAEKAEPAVSEPPRPESKAEALKNPGSEVAQLAKGNPNYSVKPFMQGKEAPEGIKTIGDLVRAVNWAPSAQAPAPQAPPASAPPAAQTQAPPTSPAPAGTAPAQQTPAPQPPAAPGSPPASPSQAPATPSKPPKYQAPAPEDPQLRANRNELQSLIDKTPELAAALKSFAKKKSQAQQDAEANPDHSAQDYLQDVLDGETLPPGIVSLADLQAAMALPPAPKEKKQKPAQAEKNKPEKGTWGLDLYGELDKQQQAQAYGKGQPDRPVTTSERQEATRQLYRAFPTTVAAELARATPPYHPDEVRELIQHYNTAQALPTNDLSKFVNSARGFFATDPNKVPPPRFVESSDWGGAEVELSALSPEEQAKAVRKHRVATIAMSLAAKAAVSKQYESQGMPPGIADTVSGFLLSGKNEPPANREKRAEKLAQQVFLEGIGSGEASKPLSPKAINKLLQGTDDPAVKKMIVAHCQAQDYREARKLFLDPTSTSISEHKKPRAIASEMSKAARFLRERDAQYPDTSSPQDTYGLFRNRVMKHLNNLSPEKAAQVEDLLDVQDNRHYDEQLTKYKRAAKQYSKKRAEAESHFADEYKQYSERLRKGGDPNEAPPPNVEDRLVKGQVVKPREPIKPINYNKLKKPEGLGTAAQDLWKKFQNRLRPGVANRVASRCSTYSATCAMDRTAVYWGVDPNSKDNQPERYTAWQQPRARDLGEGDYSKILTAARSWLKEPVLSKNIEGVVRDTQLRAALDLALRAENYDRAVHPAIYNKLLARLAGVSEKETLLTVRSKTARNTMSRKVELETARADRLLAGLDRIASVVQSNHEQWGMDFRAAKNLVNAIDKVADDLETATYGEESLLNRQTQEIGQAKLAKVLQRDSDEKYMSAFDNPMKPHQTEADEKYMQAYKDDQSSAVRNGKSLNGRPLAK